MPASLWQGWDENLCVKFSSHHRKIKRCNCWQWPGLTGGKRAFLSTSMFGSWPCSYWPSYPHCLHAPCDDYNPPQLPALLHSHVHRDNCLLWVDCECLSWDTHLSCPSTPQLSSHPWSLLECHHVSVSVSLFWGPWACPFYVAWLSHNRKFSSGPSRHIGQGREKSCPRTLYGQILQHPLWLLTFHITDSILIFRDAGGKIGAWRLWYRRPSQRWAWLVVLHDLRSEIFLLVTVWIHYNPSYLILRKQTSPFYMRSHIPLTKTVVQLLEQQTLKWYK